MEEWREEDGNSEKKKREQSSYTIFAVPNTVLKTQRRYPNPTRDNFQIEVKFSCPCKEEHSLVAIKIQRSRKYTHLIRRNDERHIKFLNTIVRTFTNGLHDVELCDSRIMLLLIDNTKNSFSSSSNFFLFFMLRRNVMIILREKHTANEEKKNVHDTVLS